MPDSKSQQNIAIQPGTSRTATGPSERQSNKLVKSIRVQPGGTANRAIEVTSSGMLQQNLLKAISANPTRSEALTAVLRVMTESSTPVGLLYFGRNDEGELEAEAELSPAGTGNVQVAYQKSLKSLCDAVCEKGSYQVGRLDAKGRLIAVAAPIMLRGQAPEAISAIFAGGNIDQAVGVMQVVAAHVTLWQILQVTKAAEFESRSTAALLELLGKCDSSRNLQQASITLVNELKDYLECDQVALGLCGISGKSTHLQAVSGMSQFDKRSEFASAMEAALDEAILRDELTTWPAPHEGQQNAALRAA